MTTEEKPIKENQKDLTSEFNDKVARLESQITSLNQVVATVLDKKFAAPEADELIPTPVPEEKDIDWEESFRLDPASSVNKLVDPKLAAIEKKLEKKVLDNINRTTETKKLDAQAYTEFPQLNDVNHPLRRETERILAERRKNNPAFDASPSAIYDAANLAYAKLVRIGTLVPDKFQEEVQRLTAIADGTLLPVTGSKKGKDRDAITPEQMLWAKKLGVSVEAYTKRKKDLISRKALVDED